MNRLLTPAERIANIIELHMARLTDDEQERILLKVERFIRERKSQSPPSAKGEGRE